MPVPVCSLSICAALSTRRRGEGRRGGLSGTNTHTHRPISARGPAETGERAARQLAGSDAAAMVLKFGRRFIPGDEFWNEGDGSENGGGERSPAAPASEALGADTKPSPPPADEDEPKLKVNASLATDPALRESPAAPAAADTSSPVDALRFKPDAGLPLFPSGSSPGIFCLPAVPEASVPRTVKQENLEAVVVAVPPPPPVPAPRQGKRPFGAGGVEPLGGPAGGAAAVAAISCFTCLPCNIKFSSRSTLEAHQTYYCSHRASAAPPRPSSPATPLTGKEGSSDTEPGSPGGGEGAEESAPPAAKVARRQYACPHCSYSADKKVSLNRHMRMHAAAPVSPAAPATPASSDQEQPPDAEALAAAAAGAALPPPALDRYCANCDIRFSNVRTYKAHKAHYCDTRHVVKPNAPSSPANASQASSGADLSRVGSAASPEASPAPPQAYLALPTTPVLLVPYHLVQAASLVTAPPLPAGAAHPGSACLVLLNGAVQPLELPPERPPTPPPPPPRRPEKHHRPSQASSEVCVNGGTFPLDLSLPRSGSGCGSDPEDEKENRGLNTSSPSQGSSRASSPASASPRPHHRLNGAAAPAKKQPEPPPTPPDALRKTPTTLLPPHLKLPKVSCSIFLCSCSNLFILS
ncbi:Hypothetical predicted protein [Cloeon dipterum]|uniref:C2H2-type domain-containing protein n=1 Tax=Cloeon dipterum TaxID=197152 RepID=A0A8S1DUP2_9INSE|nr:Hypothetical predicted protein [Cloeon dipterum]